MCGKSNNNRVYSLRSDLIVCSASHRYCLLFSLTVAGTNFSLRISFILRNELVCVVSEALSSVHGTTALVSVPLRVTTTAGKERVTCLFDHKFGYQGVRKQ